MVAVVSWWTLDGCCYFWIRALAVALRMQWWPKRDEHNLVQMYHMLIKAKRMMSLTVIYSPSEPELEPKLEPLLESELELEVYVTVGRDLVKLSTRRGKT